jgi:hypothetical protein
MLADVHGLQAYQASLLASTDFNVASDARIIAQKGQASGLATLDTNGKIPVAQLTSGSLEYQGTWNATSNTPTLVSSTGTLGNFYVVSTAGSTAIDGTSTWIVGDWIMFNGTIWQRVINSNVATWYHVDSTTPTNTTSSTDAVMNTMTVTPTVAGIYQVTFEAQASVSAAATVTYSIYNNGVQRTNTVRTSTTAGAGIFTMIIKDIFTWSTGAVAVNFNTSGGTAIVNGRSLTLVKIA